MLNGDTALGQQFLDIPVGQPVSRVPALRNRTASSGSDGVQGGPFR